jgi:hypothetical protein
MLDPYTSDKIKNVIKKQVEDTKSTYLLWG